MVGFCTVLPSLKSDGSIEAEAKSSSHLFSPLVLPSLKSDGSIEATEAEAKAGTNEVITIAEKRWLY